MAERVVRLPALRELYKDQSDEKTYRVVHVERESSEVVLCYIHGSRLNLKVVSVTDFCTRSARDYSGVDRFARINQDRDPYNILRRRAGGTSGCRDQSEANWKRIEPLHNDPRQLKRALRGGSGRTQILQDIADDAGVTIQRIRELFRHYLQRGMDEAAVSSEYWRCGRDSQPPRWETGEDAAPTVASRKYKKRAGRRPSDPRPHAPRTDALERLFEQCVDLYLTSKLGPWTLDLSQEDEEKIRSVTPGARFPSTRRARKQPKRRESSKRRPKRGAGRRGGRRARVTWQDLTDFLNYVCRCVREVRDHNGQIIELELAPFGIITQRQLTHYYQTRVPPEARKRRKMGDRQYARHGRPIKGHALQHSVGPGQEYLIDATIADVFLVLSYNRAIVVGRPTVYLAMDVWSRMIVGFYVTFDPPSFEGVALMLENIATPKDELCARFGIKIDWEDWPCEYLPQSRFFADRGSDFMKTVSWQAVNEKLGVAISNAKAGDPTMRAIVERRFGSLPAHFQRATFGVVEADATTRGAPHYAWDANHTISEFTRKLIRAILRQNSTPIGRKGALIEMATEGIADTPLNRWNYGIETMTGTLRKHSLDEIRRATWPRDEAKPKLEGLHWRNLDYTSPYIESKHVHLLGKNSKKPVEIQFNPDDPSQILIPGDMKWEYASLSKTNKVVPGGKTLTEWEMYRHIDRSNARKRRREQEEGRIMDAVNNAEESRAAKREQATALKQAGIDHPRQQRRQKSPAKLGTSEMVKKMSKSRSATSGLEQRRDESPNADEKLKGGSHAKDSLAGKMSKNIRNILNSI